MSSDPFAQPGWDSAGDPRERARSANTLGLLAVTLCLATLCASCLTLLPALPIGVMAIHQSRSVLASTSDEVALVLARNGQTLGILATAYASIVLAIVLAYLLLYVSIFGLVMAVG